MVQDVHRSLDTPNVPANSSEPEVSRAVSYEQPVSRNVTAHSAQLSLDLANVRFFGGNCSDQSEPTGLSRLFAEPSTPKPAEQEKYTLTTSAECSETATIRAEKGHLFVAQSLSEIENVRCHRFQFSQRLQSALSEQKTELQSEYEKETLELRQNFEALADERHDSSAQLHNIELLNMQDDHDAEVKDLRQDISGLRARLANKDKSLRSLNREVRSMKEQSSSNERQLQHKSQQFDQLLRAFHERESILQRQTAELYSLREQLGRRRPDHNRLLRHVQNENANVHRENAQLVRRYNGLLTRFNQLNSDRQDNEAQLDATRVTLQEREQAFETLNARYDYVVAEKARDFSWHVAHRVNPASMKPLPKETELAEATTGLRKKLEEQVQVSADLRRQLEAAQATRKARVKKLKRVVANQSQEKVILEMALSMAQDQRDHWAEQYHELAEAVASKFSFSSSARGLAERHLLLQETRFALESQLLESNLRGDRAVLECAIREQHEKIKLEKRDAEIAALTEKFEVMKQKFEYENGIALLYKDVIDREAPGLRARNSEVEKLLEDQIIRNVSANHRAVFDDLHRRIRDLEETNQWWQQSSNLQLQENGSVQSEFMVWTASTFFDLTNSRSWRDQRDTLQVENATLRERFFHELLLEPLVIPEGRLTSKQIEEEFILERITEFLAQWKITFSALPRTVIDNEAPPWEQLKASLSDDMAELTKKWIAQRDAEIASFQHQTSSIPDDHEWINDDEFEALWKGKGAQTGEELGNDGQLAAEEEPVYVRPIIAGSSWAGDIDPHEEDF
jgi:hypothetical protein